MKLRSDAAKLPAPASAVNTVSRALVHEGVSDHREMITFWSREHG
jgi:hypothetical protein